MRILYVGSNPQGAASLALEREVTRIQQRLGSLTTAATPLEFRALPHLNVEELIGEIREFSPCILHLSIHGSRDHLEMQSDDRTLRITPERLKKLLAALPEKPRLVYLSGCNQAENASVLINVVDFAIGTTAEIENQVSIQTAVVFYEWLAKGYSVQAALNAASAICDVMSEGKVLIKIYCREGLLAEQVRLRALPMIVAQPPRGQKDGVLRTDRKRDGYYNLEFGLINFPPDTIQIVLIVTDPTFFDNAASVEPSEVLDVCRESPWPSTWWFNDQWDAAENYFVYVIGVRAHGDTFTLRSTPSEALRSGIDFRAFKLMSQAERKRVEAIVGELSGNPSVDMSK